MFFLDYTKKITVNYNIEIPVGDSCQMFNVMFTFKQPKSLYKKIFASLQQVCWNKLLEPAVKLMVKIIIINKK